MKEKYVNSKLFYAIFFIGFISMICFTFNADDILYKKSVINSSVIGEIVYISDNEPHNTARNNYNGLSQYSVVCQDDNGNEYVVVVGQEICYVANVGDKIEFKTEKLISRIGKKEIIVNTFVDLV